MKTNTKIQEGLRSIALVSYDISSHGDLKERLQEALKLIEEGLEEILTSKSDPSGIKKETRYMQSKKAFPYDEFCP